MNVSPKTIGTTLVAAFMAVMSGCSMPTRPTSDQTAGMPRSPIVVGDSMKVPVEMNPCLRAGIDARKISDVTREEYNYAASSGAVRKYKDHYLFRSASITDGWQTLGGALAGGILANVVGKGLGAHGGLNTAITAGGALGGAAVGSSFATESDVGKLAEIKACEQYLDTQGAVDMPITPYAPTHNIRFVDPTPARPWRTPSYPVYRRYEW